jgi:cell division protein ZipA
MELTVTNISLLIGGLILVALVADGIRRTIRARRSELRMNLDLKVSGTSDVDPLDDLNHELPSGGARVISRNGESYVSEERDDLAHGEVQDTPTEIDTEFEAAVAEDSFSDASLGDYESQEDRDEYSDEPLYADDEEVVESHHTTYADVELRTVPDDFPTNIQPVMPTQLAIDIPELAETVDDVEAEVTGEPERDDYSRTAVKSQDDDGYQEAELEPGHNLRVSDDVLTVFVRAKSGRSFVGFDVVAALLENQVKYGAKRIFHAHDGNNTREEVTFSVANMVEPGFFDLDSIDDFETTGLIFFMGLPKHHADASLKQMISVARKVAQALEGDLYDQELSAFTQQTLLHYQERVHEFERQRLTAAHTEEH